MECLGDNMQLSAALGISAALLWALGLNLVKFTRTSVRLLGVLTIVGAYVLYFTALYYGSELGVNPLLTAAIVFNLFFAHCLRGEHTSPEHIKYYAVGVGLIAIGIPLVTVSVASCAPHDTLAIDALSTYLAISAIAVAIMLKYMIDGANARIAKKTDENVVLIPRLRIFYPLVSAICFTTSWVIFEIATHAERLRPLTLLSIMVMLLHVIILYAGLQQFEARLIAPIFVTCMIALNTVMSFLIFHSISSLSPEQIAAQSIGVICLVVAMLCLSHSGTYTYIDDVENEETNLV